MELFQWPFPLTFHCYMLEMNNVPGCSNRQFEFTTKNKTWNDAHSISLCSLWTTCHNFISDILWQICREQNICKSAINSVSLIWWQENNVSRARACKWVTKYRFIRNKKNEKEKSALKDNSIKVKVRSKWIVTRIEEIDENRVRVWSLKCRQDFCWWFIKKKKRCHISSRKVSKRKF